MRAWHSFLRSAMPAWMLLALGVHELAGCTYLRHYAEQTQLASSFKTAPTQRVSKHLLETSTFFVHGRLLDDDGAYAGRALAVAAVSNRFKDGEIVDTTQLGRAQSFYGLNLPEGDYRLLVFADLDGDGRFDSHEVVGEAYVAPSAQRWPARVIGNVDIALGAARSVALAGLPLTAASAPAARAESLFYPKGSLRTLDDPIFSEDMSELGMYEPAAFVETAPMMFYALDEDRFHKIPVVFVHGIGGSARDFGALASRLDARRYKAWFFHYPSGVELHQTAKLFYDIFLSGAAIPLGPMPIVIVAHSMGGLVVREAMNSLGSNPGENRVGMFMTLATPFGGHPSARYGIEHAPMIVPSWRDMDPDGHFIAELFRKPLPAGLPRPMLYAYRDEAALREDGDDGVVPLTSELATPALLEATAAYGFMTGHAQILNDPAAIDQVLTLIDAVPNPLPLDHLRLLDLGGFAVPAEGYDPVVSYMLTTMGCYLEALAGGRVAPITTEQAHFIEAANGRAAPRSAIEIAWQHCACVRSCDVAH